MVICIKEAKLMLFLMKLWWKFVLMLDTTKSELHKNNHLRLCLFFSSIVVKVVNWKGKIVTIYHSVVYIFSMFSFSNLLMSFDHVLVSGTTKLTLVYCDTQSVELLLVRVVLSMHKLVQKHTNASIAEKRLMANQ